MGDPESVDVRSAVCAAWRSWLSENKRLDNYRLAVRNLEALISQLRHAACAAVPAADAVLPRGAEVEAPLIDDAGEIKAAAGSLADVDDDMGCASDAAAADAAAGCSPQPCADDSCVPPGGSPDFPCASAGVGDPADAAAGAHVVSGESRVVLRLLFGDGTHLRSLYQFRAASEAEPTCQVDLLVGAQQPGATDEVTFVEFHGRRSADFRIDEAKYLVDHALVSQLQRALMPSLERPIVPVTSLRGHAGSGVLGGGE
eukprot:gnl/TRDRNA2_/TRDRNA2_131046_c0_seq1.p1 gnl/TRDRNA2_/TRDRNA2_131046_c0~~gnl/TRDRNA2_/TRDRNA2_131046_c0_seq1.p1  ORF type:complete len:266 (-),score=40.15 gnl/TRDRNA2_/TRDRNA2_131046_c0_seq1:166-936(-)